MTVEQTLTAQELSLSDPQAQVFDLEGTQLLLKGRTNDIVASSDDMTARVKVYAEGGENATHTHLEEDHIFFILQGEATFFLGRNADEVKVIEPMGGILLPKGSYYRFQSTGDENLVLFRTGSYVGDSDRVTPSGEQIVGGSKENHHVVGVPAEGKVFSAK
jgi:mannose-6-phosphate isomerase-like protein (cupin superfamily)